MQILRDMLDKLEPHFHKGGKLEKLFPAFEMIDTFLYTPPSVTKGQTHLRDAIDLKRMMIMVAIACTPVAMFAMYNTGLQANTVLATMGKSAEGWRAALMTMLGLGFDPGNICHNFIHGLLYFLPVYLVTNIVGGAVEAIFSLLRGHEINEGFLVTGILFPLTLPPTIPLWQVAIAIAFAVIFAKEVFGGTGKNFLNVALVARAFLFFAYPSAISGDKPWVAVDGFSGATALTQAKAGLPISVSWFDAFVGFMPGSMGETSALLCLVGAVILIATGVGSWRIMLSLLISTVGFAFMFNMIGSSTNPMFALNPMWHIVIGGWAFGTVFMATDPVSASMTQKGQWFYGGLIGLIVILVRVVNPAYPEGMMLAILFGNMFAPLIDWFVVDSYIKGKEARYAKR